MIDLQIGSTGTEADVWKTISKQLCTCGRRSISYTRDPTFLATYSTVMYNYPYPINNNGGTPPPPPPTSYVP
jgi:hypothetical protein